MTMSNSTPSNEDLDASFAAKLTEIHRLLDTGNLEEAKQIYESNETGQASFSSERNHSG